MDLRHPSGGGLQAHDGGRGHQFDLCASHELGTGRRRHQRNMRQPLHRRLQQHLRHRAHQLDARDLADRGLQAHDGRRRDKLHLGAAHQRCHRSRRNQLDAVGGIRSRQRHTRGRRHELDARPAQQFHPGSRRSQLDLRQPLDRGHHLQHGRRTHQFDLVQDLLGEVGAERDTVPVLAEHHVFPEPGRLRQHEGHTGRRWERAPFVRRIPVRPHHVLGARVYRDGAQVVLRRAGYQRFARGVALVAVGALALGRQLDVPQRRWIEVVVPLKGRVVDVRLGRVAEAQAQGVLVRGLVQGHAQVDRRAVVLNLIDMHLGLPGLWTARRLVVALGAAEIRVSGKFGHGGAQRRWTGSSRNPASSPSVNLSGPGVMVLPLRRMASSGLRSGVPVSARRS